MNDQHDHRLGDFQRSAHPAGRLRDGPSPTCIASSEHGSNRVHRRLRASLRCVLLSALLGGSAAVAQSATPMLNFSGLPTQGLAEEATVTYGIALAEAPTGHVDVLMDFSSPLKAFGEEVSGGELWLSFDAGNWDVPRTVTISAEHDDDGNDETATIRYAVWSDVHDGKIISIPITIFDDEQPRD